MQESTIFYSSFELVIVQSKGRRFLVKCWIIITFDVKTANEVSELLI